MLYAFDEKERDALGQQKNIDPAKWQRFKGLGEMNVEELAETTLNRDTRVLKRMTMAHGEQAAQAAELFGVLMGNDVATRKDYIVERSGFIDPDILDI